MTSTTATPGFTNPANRLAYMRKYLHPYWAPIEAGGVFLITGYDDEVYWRFLAEFSSVPEAAVARNDDERFRTIASFLAGDTRRFFERAELAPGRYELENCHRDDEPEDAKDGGQDDGVVEYAGDEPFHLPAGRRFVFQVTQEHLMLIRHMNTRDWYGHIEAMDPKRPYGDMTYHYIDMAEALEEGPLPTDENGYARATEEQVKRYDSLHWQMLFAIQAFWQYARAK